jgi:hypothetical protein
MQRCAHDMSMVSMRCGMFARGIDMALNVTQFPLQGARTLITGETLHMGGSVHAVR